MPSIVQAMPPGAAPERMPARGRETGATRSSGVALAPPEADA
jgi:hypothetical protein